MPWNSPDAAPYCRFPEVSIAASRLTLKMKVRFAVSYRQPQRAVPLDEVVAKQRRSAIADVEPERI
jgi:hypothetical protein